MRLKLDYSFNLQYPRHVSIYIQSWHDGRLVDALYAHARFDDLYLDARSEWVGRQTISVACSLASMRAISIKLTTTVDHFLHDLDVDFANLYIACFLFLYS